MNATARPTATDQIRYVFAEVNSLLGSAADVIAGGCYEQQRPAGQHTADLDHVLELLDACRKTIFEAVQAVTTDRDDMERYDDGRSVSTTVELEPGCYFTYDWHPDPTNRLNQPRELCTTELRNGRRKRILVVTPGVLDTADASLRLIDGEGGQ
ncbi:hypothetical protein [Mycolicibacter arupensis]|uniref:Uncharacterized protein n=1 Tax=Mycolicibacter arupensis TaxID=342002 RepID=A0A5C7Y402_9MYCO|nr:hypothetical protein [Mycolicibacter arupensis]TXI56487.1 MAG: hypothetical protein E6Q54_10470 [Mycolicibacter arupensis]